MPVSKHFAKANLIKKVWLYVLFYLITGIFTIVMNASASVQVSAETTFIFNTISFLMHRFLVMWMVAGLCMLEAGLVQSKNTIKQRSKNIGLYSIAGLMYWLLGYNFIYNGVDYGWIGTRRPQPYLS
jgi:Amt family ammonium transporter